MIRALVIGVGAAAAAVAIAGISAGRRLHEGWGVDPIEAARTLPGDDLVGTADAVDTRGIDIDAPIGTVWPWLVQMGYGRAGWYSYDSLDMDQPSAHSIEERWQGLEVGDIMPTHPGGGFEVRVLEPQHALVLYADRALVEAQESAAKSGGEVKGDGAHDDAAAQGIDAASANVRATGAYLDRAVSGDFTASWAFVLEPRPDGGTRLIERFRAGMELPAKAASLGRFARSFLGFGVFVMVRRQMLGIKDRAEGRADRVLVVVRVPARRAPRGAGARLRDRCGQGRTGRRPERGSARARSSAKRSVGSPWVGRTSSTGSCRSGLRPSRTTRGGTSSIQSVGSMSPAPRSMSVSPATRARRPGDPQNEVVRLLAQVRLDTDGKSFPGPEHATAERGVVAGVRRRRVDRDVQPQRDVAGTALVPGAGQHDRDLPAGDPMTRRAHEDHLGRVERVEQQQPTAVLDRVRRDHRVPVRTRAPSRVLRLPMPHPGSDSPP